MAEMGELALAEATNWTGEPTVAPGEGELTDTPAKAAAVMNKQVIVRQEKRLSRICLIFYSTPGGSFVFAKVSFLLAKMETTDASTLIQLFFQSS